MSDPLADAISAAEASDSGMQSAGQANNVWQSFSNTVSSVTDSILKLRASSPATTAAPSGRVGFTGANPLPGTQGSYPQAEAKPAPGGSVVSQLLNGVSGWIIGAVVVIVLLALARR